MQNNARTHRSTPCAGREAFGNQRELVRKRDLASRAGRSPLPTGGRSRPVCPRRRGEVTPPYGCNTGSAKQRADVGIGPYGKERKPHQPPGPAAHSGAFAARVRRNGWESRQSSPPKWPATSDNPSVSLRLTAPFTQGSLVLRGTGVRAAESSAPMESPSQPARSEASAPAAARDGRESAPEPSQKEDRPRDHSGSA